MSHRLHRFAATQRERIQFSNTDRTDGTDLRSKVLTTNGHFFLGHTDDTDNTDYAATQRERIQFSNTDETDGTDCLCPQLSLSSTLSICGTSSTDGKQFQSVTICNGFHFSFSLCHTDDTDNTDWLLRSVIGDSIYSFVPVFGHTDDTDDTDFAATQR